MMSGVAAPVYAVRGYEVLSGVLGREPAPLGLGLTDPDRTPTPWESSLQATCECLSWRGSLDNLRRRHAEDQLGETVYARFPVHARSAAVLAHSLIEAGLIGEDELHAKMSEVRARFERD